MPIELLDRRFKVRGLFTFTRVSGRSSRFIRIPMKSRLIRVEAKFKNVKETWYRAGYLNHIHNGIISKGIVIKFGIQLIVMPDSLPYTLEFSPVSWLPDGYLRISEYLLPLSNEELIQVSLSSPNPPSLSTLSTLLNMSLTDIASFKASIKALADKAAATETATVSLGQTIVTIEASMVRQYTSQDILKTMFVQLTPGSAWTYDVVHGLNDAFASDEVFDVQKQKQLLQTSPIDSNTVRLELSQDEYDSADFPLVCSVQGKAIAANSSGVLMPGGENTYRLVEDRVERLMNGSTEFDTIYTNVVTAFLSATSRVYAYLADGTANWKADGSDVNNVITLSEYADEKLLLTSIEL